MTAARAGDVLFLIFLAAMVYILVRPRSQAGQMVQVAGDALIAVVRKAADLAS